MNGERVVCKMFLNQDFLYQKCQTYCIIFKLVSFLGNTLRMFKGCGKEETPLLRKLALAGIQTAT